MIKAIVMSILMTLSIQTACMTETTSQLEAAGWELTEVRYEDHSIIQEWKTTEGEQVNLGYYR